MVTILDALAKMIQDTLENKLLESVFLNSEYYGICCFHTYDVFAYPFWSGKFVLSLDEMLPQVSLLFIRVVC